MVAGLQPNWRIICVVVFLLILIWYVFFSNDKNVTIKNHPLIPEQPVKKIQVEVYYEVWCPDSRRFILDQALPAWRKLNTIADIHWKPYGKATHLKDDKQVTGYSFDCQHGPEECMGNMIHACAIQYVKDQKLLNELIGCMMDGNMNVKENAENCAKSHKVDWLALEACLGSKEGGQLLAMHGDDTHSLKPGVRFIPTIQINGSQDGQNQFLKNLAKAICEIHKKIQTTSESPCDNL